MKVADPDAADLVDAVLDASSPDNSLERNPGSPERTSLDEFERASEPSPEQEHDPARRDSYPGPGDRDSPPRVASLDGDGSPPKFGGGSPKFGSPRGAPRQFGSPRSKNFRQASFRTTLQEIDESKNRRSESDISAVVEHRPVTPESPHGLGARTAPDSDETKAPSTPPDASPRAADGAVSELTPVQAFADAVPTARGASDAASRAPTHAFDRDIEMCDVLSDDEGADIEAQTKTTEGRVALPAYSS